MQVKLISITKPLINIEEGKELTPEGLIAYCARVSSNNQDNPDYEGLLRYCIKNKHWSIFEMVDMTVEITTSRAIAQQILRHRSGNFQERSLRYATSLSIETYSARRQDYKNRQNSFDDLNNETKKWFIESQERVNKQSVELYNAAIEKGIAKESARFLLPLSTTTVLYMKNNIRNWLTYLNVRLDKSTQLEHREIAVEIAKILAEQFPIIAKSVNNFNNFEGNFISVWQMKTPTSLG